MVGQPDPLTLRYYADQERVKLITALVNAITAGVAALLGVRAVLELPIFPFGRNWSWGIAGVAGVVIFLFVFTWSRTRMFRPWCHACRRRVPLHERIIGLSVTLDDVKNPSESAVLRLLGRGDWSPLRDAQRPQQWGDPSVFIGLGRCETCRGPFIVTSDIRAQDTRTNTIYFGCPFRGEVDEDSASDLLDAARRNGLFLRGKIMSNR